MISLSLVEFYNSQVVLKGCEEPGYVIIAAAKASILTSDHQPVWRDQTFRSKASIVGSIDCVQVRATGRTTLVKRSPASRSD